jgi:TRAP-type C4-dicarboxylate transport system permease small subunit
MFLLVSMTAIVTVLGIYQIFGRYFIFLRLPISWTEEAMRYIYVAIIMLGISAVYKSNSFATITIFSDFIAKKSKKGLMILNVFQNAVQVVFYGLMFYYGIFLVLRGAGQTAATTGVSFGIIYLPVPIGGFLGFMHALQKLFTGFKTNNDMGERSK